jgi:hypothetical protein
VFLELPPGAYVLPGGELNVAAGGMGQRHFVDCGTGHRLVADFRAYDFWFWHDETVGRPTPLLATVLDPPPAGWDAILESGNGLWEGDWKSVPAAAERRFGRGIVRVCQVKLAHRLGTNPVAAIFVRRLLGVEPAAKHGWGRQKSV